MKVICEICGQMIEDDMAIRTDEGVYVCFDCMDECEEDIDK